MLGLLAPLWRYVAAAGALLAAVLTIYLRGRRDAARDIEAKALRQEVQAREKADAASVEYRAGGGAAGRLRDGRF